MVLFSAHLLCEGVHGPCCITDVREDLITLLLGLLYWPANGVRFIRCLIFSKTTLDNGWLTVGIQSLSYGLAVFFPLYGIVVCDIVRTWTLDDTAEFFTDWTKFPCVVLGVFA